MEQDHGIWLVRQSITRAIANTGRTIRLPVRAGEVKAWVERARRELEVAGGRPPTVAQIAAFLSLETVEVRDALRWGSEPLSLFGLTGWGGLDVADAIADATSPPVADQALTWAARKEAQRLLSRLGQRERQVLALRFGLGCGEPRALAAVGADLGLTPQAVAAIQNAAIVKLRRGVGSSQGLRDPLAS